jgi:hypothetical protein
VYVLPYVVWSVAGAFFPTIVIFVNIFFIHMRQQLCNALGPRVVLAAAPILAGARFGLVFVLGYRYNTGLRDWFHHRLNRAAPPWHTDSSALAVHALQEVPYAN